MARRRKDPKDAWLPNRVYRGKSAYEWRPKDLKAIALLPITRDAAGNVQEPPTVKRLVLEAYEAAGAQDRRPKNIDYWLDKFLISDRYLRLGRLTQADYIRYIETKVDVTNPKNQATHNGIRFVFGEMRPEKVSPMHIRKYMDYWASAQAIELENGTVIESEGKPTTANRHLSTLQTFFNWVRQYVPGIETNPADRITKFQENTRQVYIDDEDYLKLLQAALDSSTPWLFAFFEIAYLCGLRLAEVNKLNHDDIVVEDGKRYLRIIRSKGSKGELTEITERLQNAISFAESLYPIGIIEPIRKRPIVRNTRGDRITHSAVNNAVRNIRKASGVKNFRVHDLKKKAGTDGKDLGHRTKRMAELYNLKLKKSTATR